MKLPFLSRLLEALKAGKANSKDKAAPKRKASSKRSAAAKGKSAKGTAPGPRKPVARSQPARRTVMEHPELEVTIPAASPVLAPPSAEAGAHDPQVAEAASLEAALTPEPAVAEALEPEPSELEAAVSQGEPARIGQVLVSLTQGARAIQRTAADKKTMLASYEAQVSRAIGARDFLTLSFVGSSLVIDAAFFREELLGLAEAICQATEAFGQTPFKKLAPLAKELSAQIATFQELLSRKRKALELLEGRLLKAFKAKDYAALSDLTSALSRDAIMLAALDVSQSTIGGSEQTGLTATSASEKVAMLDQQVAQLHQAIADRRFPAIADIARLISLNSGVLADPSTTKAAQILQYGQQLAAALKGSPDTPATMTIASNLIKTASIFNGPLMDKANQLEGQVAQLATALGAFDQAKMFTLAVTIARSGAILTDATIQKASLLAGYASRIDVSLKRKDFPGAAAVLRSAMS